MHSKSSHSFIFLLPPETFYAAVLTGCITGLPRLSVHHSSVHTKSMEKPKLV